MDGDGPLSIGALTALAGRTGFCHDSSCPFALAAGTGDAEEPLLEPHLSGPFATGARLDRCGILGAAPFAVAAHFPSRDFEFGLFSVDGFFEGQIEIVLKVVAALRPSAASLAPEKIFEDVVEGVAEAASAKSEAIRTATLLSPCVAEHVVAFAFILIAQGLVGFIDFFELFF